MRRTALMVALLGGCIVEQAPHEAIGDPTEETSPDAGPDMTFAPQPVTSTCTWGLRDLEWRTVTVAVEVYSETSGIQRCSDELMIMGNEILTTVVPCDWDGIHRLNLRLPNKLYTHLEIRSNPPIDTYVIIGQPTYITITPDKTSFYRFVTVVD